MNAKSTSSLNQERRKQKALERLGTNHPRCVLCGEADWRCLEVHHLGQEDYDDLGVILCRNCHRKLSDHQADHPGPIGGGGSALLEQISHILLGLADFFVLLVEKLRTFGHALIERAQSELALSASPASAPRRRRARHEHAPIVLAPGRIHGDRRAGLRPQAIAVRNQTSAQASGSAIGVDTGV